MKSNEYGPQDAVDQMSKDADMIMAYLKYTRQDSGVIAHPSGLYYKIMEKGNGRDTITLNNVPVVIYTRSVLLQNRVVESSQGLPTSFDGRKLKDHIAGWQIGLPQISKGGRILMYIPSSLAFGPVGVNGVIPPNAILACDVTLVDFK
ncbi:FKBP-type peptidyl-prolyl cis-trans isomerase [Chitinophaga lutea]